MQVQAWAVCKATRKFVENQFRDSVAGAFLQDSDFGRPRCFLLGPLNPILKVIFRECELLEQLGTMAGRSKKGNTAPRNVA
jgi:hypothetical protein